MCGGGRKAGVVVEGIGYGCVDGERGRGADEGGRGKGEHEQVMTEDEGGEWMKKLIRAGQGRGGMKNEGGGRMENEGGGRMKEGGG